MFYILATFLLPPLFVFGLYHMLIWGNVGGFNRRSFWKRVAITSGVSHVLLASGFFVFTYVDSGNTASFGVHLFENSNFWKLMTIFDTIPMLILVAVFSAFDRAGMNPPVVAITLSITYVVGTLQWFLVGGALGALGERFFEGLKTPDPEDEWWSDS